MSDPSPAPRWFPRSGWWILGALGLCILLIALRVGLPIWRRATFISHVHEIGGKTLPIPGGPAWLRECLGDSAMVGFDEQWEITLPAATIDDQLLSLTSMYSELTVVNLVNATVGRGGLAALGSHPRLHTVNLFDSNFDDEGVSALSKSKTIREILAGWSQVTDSGLRHLSQMTQLSYLGLRGDAITDAGLAQLACLTNLLQLNLAETRVTDDGLQHLTSLNRLQFVALFDTAVTQTGILDFVATHPHLTEIQLSPHQISADVIDDLQRERPKLKIVITVGENDGSGFSRRRHK